VSHLTVTAYNVGFGDALLIEFPDRHEGHTTLRRVMIDMGNVRAGPGGEAIFRSVAEDIRSRLDGGAIDLFVMTHEHLDHIRGLPYAASVGLEIPVDYTWLTASSNPNYGKRYPRAQAQRLAMAEQVSRLKTEARRLGVDQRRQVRAFFANNDRGKVEKCVEFLRQMARVKRSYVHSQFRITPGKHHPFHEAVLSIWAPEPDTSTYYGHRVSQIPRPSRRRRYPPTPAGVEEKAFRKLIRSMQSGLGENMLAIDRAANNTSIVLCLEWRGWRLLFAGDAELRSWYEMVKNNKIHPGSHVHFLKISHHGSHNGTPDDEILDMILPVPRTDGRLRKALLPTSPDTYPGVPDDPTVARIAERVDEMKTTRSVSRGESVVLDFPG
jgi:beta-lactamase superfamily II metal-dependent hydrolase